MKIGVTSENKLKIEVVKEVFEALKINAEVIGFATSSGVGEQPINELALMGAKNRIKDLLGKNKNFDKIISIESGIFFEDGEWVDKAVIVIFDVNKNKEWVGFSEGVIFPMKYVEMAKRIGFDKMTVGQVMADEGFVANSKDPHLSISGKSRKEYLFETLMKLVRTDLVKR